MIDIVTELRTLLTEVGDTVDETAAEPYDWRPRTLYVYPLEPLREVAFESGPSARQEFAARAIFVAEAHEEASRGRDAALSAELDGRLGRMLEAIRTNRGTPPWTFIAAQSDPRPPATLTSRAVALRVSGYRFV